MSRDQDAAANSDAGDFALFDRLVDRDSPKPEDSCNLADRVDGGFVWRSPILCCVVQRLCGQQRIGAVHARIHSSAARSKLHCSFFHLYL